MKELISILGFTAMGGKNITATLTAVAYIVGLIVAISIVETI